MPEIIDYMALATKVLVVAVRRVEGTWCAYIDAVKGENHRQEINAVARWGNKLSEPHARFIFPRIDGEYAL